MWRCDKCGRENSDNANFCGQCGKPNPRAKKRKHRPGQGGGKAGFFGSVYFTVSMIALLFAVLGLLIAIKFFSWDPPGPLVGPTPTPMPDPTPTPTPDPTPTPTPDPTPTPEPTPEPTPNPHSPFYGIWCMGHKDYAVAEKNQLRYIEAGLDAKIFVTTEWSNLNPEKYYVVTAGTYSSKSEAEEMLPTVKKIVSGAYIKYSGDWLGG